MPTDAVLIGDDVYEQLMIAQAAGRVIQADADGAPVAIDRPTEDLGSIKAKLCMAIDDLVRAIYARYTAFKVAYDPREAAARAFKDAGYKGDPGDWVTGFAIPAALPYKDAADLIIAQAEAAYVALPKIDGQRMRKYAIMKASEASTAHAIYNDVLAQVAALSVGLP